jgi:hypothetical protein
MKLLLSKILKNLGLFSIAIIVIETLQLYFFKFFTITGIKQSINYKSIPIIIISFNQLEYLKKLINWLIKNQYLNIIIIDNNSTFEPLLKYFDSLPKNIRLYQLEENLGHLVFWKKPELFKTYCKGYYVVTDADIVPDEDCPADFLKYFIKILDCNHNIAKVGFSLKINDIPDENLNKDKILSWESKYWTAKTKDGNYFAPIDTTFAIYKRGNLDYNCAVFYNANRTKSPYLAYHGGWYIDTENLTVEQEFYFKTANESSSWKPNHKGIIDNKLYQL